MGGGEPVICHPIPFHKMKKKIKNIFLVEAGWVTDGQVGKGKVRKKSIRNVSLVVAGGPHPSEFQY